jgi:outer membrane protein OmpA-like peptidoglycan-associated protein
MHYFKTCLLLFVVTCGIHVQAQSLKQSLYYDINSVESAQNTSRLDSLLGFAGKDSVEISIQAFADFLGNTAANKKLAQRRAQAVESYLKSKSQVILIKILTTESYGEDHSKDNQSALGEPAQRRVDVLMTKKFPIKKTIQGSKKTVRVVKNARPVKKIKAPIATNGMEKLDAGQSLVIEGLFFIPGRHVWLPTSDSALLKLLQTLKVYPTMKIEIQGHICCIDGPKDALDEDTGEKKLSENRARQVYYYLSSKGIERNRMTYKGYARTQPKRDPELNSNDEQLNRRVEIKVLEK